MIKLKNIRNRIPRPVKACVCWALVIVLAITYYIALGCPTLTLRQEMRRAEKVHLVGPSKIIDTLNDEQYSEFQKLLVGETENGICFFGRYYHNYPYNNLFDEKRYMLSYIEKTDNMTLAAAPNVWGRSWGRLENIRALPVYLFVDNPEAVAAKITIRASGSINKILYAEANRSDNGFFLFWVEASDETSRTALYELSVRTGGSAEGFGSSDASSVITVSILLYDAVGTLLTTQDLTL